MITRKGFFCLGVTDETPENKIEVRARNRSDMERLKQLCPSVQDIEVYDGPLKGSDFRFKALADRRELEEYAVRSVRGVDYDRFEKTVDRETNDPARTKAYVSCRHALFLWQEQEFLP
ncbi:MAG: hypothetical protein HY788_15745 [Deltaproteobacteria bacterium]|nr:hypothetical protein [Deltaproteobacteria bacterium]